MSTNPETRRATVDLTLQQAIDEAHRCLLCHDAPCSQACPGGTDPAKFIRQIRFRNLKGAARTVLGNNPLGGVCAHVCPTDETCRAACLRTGIDEAIDIDGLQRFAVSYGRSRGLVVLEREDETQRPKVAVIGAGPAGLAAAAQLGRMGHGVTVFEGRAEAGGMLRYGVPESRLPLSALEADVKEITALGVEIRTGTLVDRADAAALLDEGYAAVFVAPGLWKAYTLDVPGVTLDGVDTAVEFLERARGPHDGLAARVRGQNVAVIGGGAVAMDVAHTAHAMGAKKVYAIALEALHELPATRSELEQAHADGVIFKPQCRVTAITGAAGKVAGVVGCETEWIESGRPVPSNARDVEGTHFELRVGVVVQAIGQGPTEVVGRILSRVDRRGKLADVDPMTLESNVKGLYAGGDVVRGPGTVVRAVADGKRAASAIHQFLSENAEVAL